MLFTRPFLLAFTLAACTTAADFAGRWAGTATNSDGQPVPLYLTINQQDSIVSGHMLRDESGEVPLSDIAISGDRIAFSLTDRGTPVKFVLDFVVFGHPLGDRNVALRGASTSGQHKSTIDLYPVRTDSFGNNGADIGPVVMHRVDAVYPEQARQTKVHGTVLLRVEIGETGLISKERIRVVRGLGHGLDEAAVRSVEQWRFRPAYRKGFAVKSTASIEVPFRL